MKKIEEISLGIDEHLRKLESFVGVLREVKLSIELLRQSQEKAYIYELGKLKKDVASMALQLEKQGLPQSSEYEKNLAEIREMLEGEEWPQAVPPEMVCDSPEKAKIRAGNILDLLVSEHLKDKSFLDFGCGDGLTVAAALEREASVAYGYDVKIDKIQAQSGHFTDSFDDIRAHAPYDIVLVHDVLDHIVAIDPIEALKMIASVLSKKGRIYLRCHPWSSRHGGHLYTQKNKAFLHLCMDEIELSRVGGLSLEHNIKVVSPLETYRFWFEEAGLNVKSELPIRTPVEEFFTIPSAVNERLRKHWPEMSVVESHMEIDFVEYILESKEINLPIF